MDSKSKSLAICQFLNTNVKKILFTFLLLYSFICNGQINTFPYSETFSAIAPTDFTSTVPNGWDFANPNNSRTGVYSAKIIKSGPPKFIYIKLNVISYNTYFISFWTKNVCKLKVSANETADQNSLLDNSLITIDNTDCKNANTWIESTYIYTPTYDGIMYFQINVTNFGVGDDAYIDDILITETPPISLPITLLYFTAKNIDQYYNRIEWSTASEDNNDYFLLEKTKDGIDFNLVCRVEGAGNSTSKREYEYYDLVVFNGIVYYRLKQVDYDGVETKYDMVSVDNRMKSSPALKKITNVLGQTTDPRPETILFFHYDDGSIVKRYFSEH